jgi:CYTH domain-containing protein
MTETSHIEIERRWLLRSLPPLKWSDEIEIRQWYFKREGQWERLRSQRRLSNPEQFLLTQKIRLTPTSQEERERELTESEFQLLLQHHSDSRFISKRRRLYSHQGLIWEVDQFDALPLIIVEVELQSPDQSIELPSEIQQRVIREITGEKEWSNRSLSKKLNQSKMTPEQFVYWLQGFLEIADSNQLTEKQIQIIKDRIHLVIDKPYSRLQPFNPPPQVDLPYIHLPTIICSTSDQTTLTTTGPDTDSED